MKPSVTKFVWQQIRPFWKSLCLMFIMIILFAAMLSFQPYVLKLIVDNLTQVDRENFWSVILPLGLAYIGIDCLYAVLPRVYEYIWDIRMNPNLRRSIIKENFTLLLQHSASYYQDYFAGSLANKLNDLKESVPDLVDRFAVVLEKLLKLSITIGMLWLVNVQFAIGMLLWSVCFIALSFVFSKKLSHASAVFSARAASITGHIVDVLTNILSVRLFAHAEMEKQNLDEEISHAVIAERQLQWVNFWVWLFYGCSFLVVLGASIYFLLKGRQEGWVTPGDFVLVLGLNTAVVEFLWEAVHDFMKITKYYGRIQQALQTIVQPLEIIDAPDAKILKVTKGEICFENVSFQYKNSDRLFSNKSIVIHPGQKVGLVGYSGGGKTTFVNLILRLYTLSAGRILIDGQDISQVTQDSLHAQIAMIPQDPSLFHRSLRDNIRYANLAASDAAVMQAAQRAKAHDFIIKVPQGYDALVGERGIKLSGGQRQRIAIARAILKNAPILILDEATSQLDSVTEQEIQAILWEVMQDKTTIVIAHRLSTLLRMDTILVFDAGVIVEQGAHSVLLEQKGVYKQLWDAQVGGFLPE